jgi:hypothetical protein
MFDNVKFMVYESLKSAGYSETAILDALAVIFDGDLKLFWRRIKENRLNRHKTKSA